MLGARSTKLKIKHTAAKTRRWKREEIPRVGTGEWFSNVLLMVNLWVLGFWGFRATHPDNGVLGFRVERTRRKRQGLNCDKDRGLGVSSGQ